MGLPTRPQAKKKFIGGWVVDNSPVLLALNTSDRHAGLVSIIVTDGRSKRRSCCRFVCLAAIPELFNVDEPISSDRSQARKSRQPLIYVN